MHILKGLLLAGLAGTAHADVITDWNEKVVNASITARQPPWTQSRSIVMVHLAMFDALNSIDPRYTPYRVQLRPVNAIRNGDSDGNDATERDAA